MCYIRKLIFVQIAIDISIYIINCHFGDKEEQGMELRDWNDLLQDEDGMGTVEIILIMVEICIAGKSRILCGNFRCI